MLLWHNGGAPPQHQPPPPPSQDLLAVPGGSEPPGMARGGGCGCQPSRPVRGLISGTGCHSGCSQPWGHPWGCRDPPATRRQVASQHGAVGMAGRLRAVTNPRGHPPGQCHPAGTGMQTGQGAGGCVWAGGWQCLPLSLPVPIPCPHPREHSSTAAPMTLWARGVTAPSDLLVQQGCGHRGGTADDGLPSLSPALWRPEGHQTWSSHLPCHASACTHAHTHLCTHTHVYTRIQTQAQTLCSANLHHLHTRTHTHPACTRILHAPSRELHAQRCAHILHLLCTLLVHADSHVYTSLVLGAFSTKMCPGVRTHHTHTHQYTHPWERVLAHLA